MTGHRVGVLRRLLSMFFDHFFMLFVMAGFMLFAILPFFLIKKYVFGWWVMPGAFGATLGLLLMGLFNSVYLNKDCFGGRAPGKRLMKLVVVNFQTGAPASPMKCLVRSVTMMFLSPIELILILFNPSRRLGDYIADTEVVMYDGVAASKTHWWPILKALLVGGILSVVLLLINVIAIVILDEYDIYHFVTEF